MTIPASRAPSPFALSVPLLAGCVAFKPMPPDQYCKEVGYAIAAVTEVCTGDTDLANDRHDAFVDQYACIEHEVDEGGAVAPEDLFDCAFRIQELPCDLVESYGDDISAYVSVSPGCALVVEPKAGG